PNAVAHLESVSFRIQDVINQYRYKISGGQAQISWSATSQPVAPTPVSTLAVAEPLKTLVPPTALAISVDASPTPTALPSSDPSSALGWQPYGQMVNGKVVLERALVTADPTRPYEAVALIRMDLTQLQLNMMPGIKDPVPLGDIPQTIPNQGTVPPSQWNVLVAAFNGGFKAIHGKYGMMVDNVTLIDPINGIATVAVYKNGDVRIGVWGKDIMPSSDIIAYRQNCPPLIENGQITNYVNNPSRQLWGMTQAADATWRTGLGITQDNRYLIYAVGNATTAPSLASALQTGGAYWAMQLDINSGYQRFITYQTNNSGTGLPLIGQPLLSEMSNDPTLYLTPSDRDFFYMTVRPQ
ncbi:MAG: phosphodiester glycosidase family protein, partial [Anaerolineales bacterium]